ncbi:Phox homologous domain [Trypanosoma melophagium]|uniref:Phox homologous domain n=1 Tax=Trypanosoma melophagium TaxID=715481 RepID=UPI00351A79AC|nr:Phox homologous domain [Trypanosoma melophagium]
MSNWSLLKENYGLFGLSPEDGGSIGGEGGGGTASCGYVVHIPPPMSGPGRPSSAVEIASISLAHVSIAPDTTHKMVTWYEVLVSTSTHKWCVLKRFSEFVDLYRMIEKVGLLQLAQRQLQRIIISPPSRLSLRQSRRRKLENFLHSLLQTLKDLSVAVVAGVHDKTESFQSTTLSVVRAAFSNFVQFLTTTSYDVSLDITSVEKVTEFSVPQEKSPRCLTMDDYGHVPPAKIVHIPERLFTIMLQLPGASLSTVYVDSAINSTLHSTSAETPQEIVVGGSWNNNITALSSVLAEVWDTCLSSGGSGCDLESNRDFGEVESSLHVLFDTFPTGEFQMKFEVPSAFAIDEWQSDYAGGVLFLTWRREKAISKNNSGDS